jgi:hypothetical protein
MELLPNAIAQFKQLLYQGKRHGEGSFMAVAIAAESVLLADREVGFGGEAKNVDEVKKDLEIVDTIITKTNEEVNTSLAVLEEAYYKNNSKPNILSFEVETNHGQSKTWNVAKLHMVLWDSMRILNNIVMKVAIKYKMDIPIMQSSGQQKIDF